MHSDPVSDPGSDDELGRDPLHLIVVGGKQDEAARTLFSALQRPPSWYKRIELWDRSEGALPTPDVAYPAPKHAAALVCTQNRCSLPLYKAEDIAAFLALPVQGGT